MATNGSSEARDASAGSLSTACAALELGAMIALADSDPSASSDSTVVPSSAEVAMTWTSCGASAGPMRPLGRTNSRIAAEVADSATADVSPQPIVTSGVISPSADSDLTALPSRAAVCPRLPGSAAMTSSSALLSAALPSYRLRS